MAYYSNNVKFDTRKRWDWHKVDLVAVQSVNPKYFDKVKKESEGKAKKDYFEKAKKKEAEKTLGKAAARTWSVLVSYKSKARKALKK